MARTFNGTSQRLRRESAVVLQPPLTLAVWVRPGRSSAYEDVLGLCNTSQNHSGHFLQLRGPDGVRAAAVTAQQGTFAIARSSDSYALNQWQHVAGVFSAADRRKVYLNGRPGAEDTVAKAPGGLNRTTVAAWESSGGVTAYFAGGTAEAAIWDAALTDAEILALAQGDSPLLVRPENLRGYWPLGGEFGENDADHSGAGNDLTADGGPGWMTHPPIRYPQPEPPPPPPSSGGPVPRFPVAAGRAWCPGAAAGRIARHVLAAGIHISGGRAGLARSV